MERISIDDFAEIFGLKGTESLPDLCKNIIEKSDFSYRILDSDEMQKAILEAIKRIDTDTQIVAVPERTQVWEKGWGENLKDFINSGYDENALIPKYNKKGVPVRWKQQFVKSNNPMIEYDIFNVLKTWLFVEYLRDCDAVYEFGCGTGHNLIKLAKMFPEKELYGMDFVQSAVDLVNLIGEKSGYNLSGKLFNMIEPDFEYKLKDNSAVLTMASIEQLAGNFKSFIKYVIEQKPELCIHVEPIIELYDRENLVDYLAYKFHHQRKYSEGLLTYLQELETQGKIQIIKVKRTFFGNYNHEGYSVIIWRVI